MHKKSYFHRGKIKIKNNTFTSKEKDFLYKFSLNEGNNFHFFFVFSLIKFRERKNREKKNKIKKKEVCSASARKVQRTWKIPMHFSCHFTETIGLNINKKKKNYQID